MALQGGMLGRGLRCSNTAQVAAEVDCDTLNASASETLPKGFSINLSLARGALGARGAHHAQMHRSGLSSATALPIRPHFSSKGPRQ